ncbi:MAG: hypothetical protein DCC68_10995 [Planctomycetota bacterium]|nr:MAG: hypothetical protein DCC68_10995 [Planctomycetota bacterium]
MMYRNTGDNVMQSALRFVVLPLVAASVLSRLVVADDVPVANRDELLAALQAAKPGTTILVAAGTYRGGIAQTKLSGTKDRPIVVAAADPKSPPVFEGGGSGLHLSSPQHVELRDLVCDGASGNGLNVDDSGSTDTPAEHLLLRNVVVRNIGPRGNTDGIKLSGVRDFRLEGCRVERWGSSGSAIDMVGCTNGVVTKCTFVDARGDMANGVQTKGGSSHIAIERCRFENAGGRAVNAGGSTGLAYFRPRDATFEAQDISVEDCEFLGGQAAVAFVGVDGAIVRHNTIYRPKRWVFRILQESTDARFVPCRNGKVENNVVAFRSDEVREIVNVGGNTAPDTFAFSGNAWSCLDRPQDTRRLVRLPVAEKDATHGEPPTFADATQGDVRIRDRKPDAPGVRAESPPPSSKTK